MTQINSYLTFRGNCREAMTFYKECLGGELTLQTVGESSMAEQMPRKMKDCILHSELKNGLLLLLGSDMVGEQGLVQGNAVSLCISCSSEEYIRRCYQKLSGGGRATHPLKDTFWGSIFGGLTDKFGNYWLLNYTQKKQP